MTRGFAWVLGSLLLGSIVAACSATPISIPFGDDGGAFADAGIALPDASADGPAFPDAGPAPLLDAAADAAGDAATDAITDAIGDAIDAGDGGDLGDGGGGGDATDDGGIDGGDAGCAASDGPTAIDCALWD